MSIWSAVQRLVRFTLNIKHEHAKVIFENTIPQTNKNALCPIILLSGLISVCHVAMGIIAKLS